MKDQVLRVDYFVHTAANRPGTGAKLHGALQKAGVNLLAAHVFPVGGDKVQVDLVPENPTQLQDVAKREGLRLQGPKTTFLVQGEDRVGALAEVLDRLGKAQINVVATSGISAGSGRYGCILWVAPQQVEAAAKALGAMTPAGKH